MSESIGTAIDVLINYQRQLDPEGIEVGVSRQALDEVLAELKTRNEWISTETVNAINRLSVMAVKHCPRDHHDWDELLSLVKALDTLPPTHPEDDSV